MQFEETELMCEFIRNPNDETLSSCLGELEKDIFRLYKCFENSK